MSSADPASDSDRPGTAFPAEGAFLKWLRSHLRGVPALSLPVGDDAAVWNFSRATQCLITTDLLLEGVHFKCPPTDPFLVGRKALAVNLSDIAAMAGIPLAAFVSVAFPRGGDSALPKQLYAGLQQLADEFDVVIAGGDTNVWDGPLIINVAVTGEATAGGPVPRSGAQPGDWIFVTGELGGSLSGRHLTFTPRLTEAQALHQAVALHSLIDLSDGLSTDLWHILEESGAGAEIFAEAVPISPQARQCQDERPPLEHALNDGEDFELLFTVSPADGEKLLAQPPCDVTLSHIGIIVAEKHCLLIFDDGRREPLSPAGWQHRW